MEKWFGGWDATHLLHDVSLDTSVNEAFCNTNVSWHGGKCGGSHFTHYTAYVAPNYKTNIFTEQGNHTHRYMLESILLSAIWTIASMRLTLHSLRCEMGIGTQVMRVVGYAQFPRNKFKRLSITLWCNALPLITFNYAFHTSSTRPNPCTNFSNSHNVHSQL